MKIERSTNLRCFSFYFQDRSIDILVLLLVACLAAIAFELLI
jgi:hypothetical protein